jgi:predicted alpha/beta-hydrolase family hydrolase
VFAGGKSMGGRMASHLAAQGEAVDGLVFLGYPLHPSGKPDKLRADHLTAIEVPMLFIQGSRDPLCRLDLLDAALKPVKAPCLVHIIEGGDHSFKVLKRLGRTEQEVWREIVDTILGWVREGR